MIHRSGCGLIGVFSQGRMVCGREITERKIRRRTHTIMPTHFATPGHLLRTTGSMSASNESCSRCAKAVASMTPVPKCFPMKNTMPGTRRPGMRRDIDGNVDATFSVASALYSKVRMSIYPLRTKERDQENDDHELQPRFCPRECIRLIRLPSCRAIQRSLPSILA